MTSRAPRDRNGTTAVSDGFHRHVHEHGSGPHEHVHHHGPEEHEHGHALGRSLLELATSPLHGLDARAKVVSALVLIVGVVLTAPLRFGEFALLTAMLLAVSAIGRLPLGWVLSRTAVVLPVAGTIALLAPLGPSGGGWVSSWAILTKAWVSVLVMVILSSTTETPALIRGLRALKVPDVFVALFSFIYRYVDVFGTELGSLRRSLDSRAPDIGAFARWRLYGNLAGNLLIRAHDRGERIHAAMLSRGFTGALPDASVPRFSVAEALVLLMSILTAAAVVLY